MMIVIPWLGILLLVIKYNGMKSVINFNDERDKKDYLSVDGLSAISSEGVVFHVGDILYKDEVGYTEIKSFVVKDSVVIALTSLSEVNISDIGFSVKKKDKDD